ncbi:uncharacterized protein DUF937 [Breoghania corrubedonensis]|uniref:Uncharacterized protein DUF937 n=1 Tax=Breoghania corrubedonensis TaxID=665038 RepID=A0A2T5VF65_9HYPH|nr:DUF937 domain-containing protein [Breoghania corrubedonensis]PTW62389.1 uncharacterized protein DUF937 [Breoghania corrubedonensis]
MTDSVFPLDPFALMSETQKRFGLREDDARRATEALIPAFWAGLRRNAAAPDGLQALMGAFTPPIFQPGGGASANPWATAGGWSGGGLPGGGFPGGDWMNAAAGSGPVGAFMAQIFPNKAIRKAVLDQVAATTGIRQDALDALMPVAATLMMGQLARNFAVGPARDLLDAFMAGFARGRPQPAPSPADMMAPFAEAMSAFFTGFARASQRNQPQSARTPEPEDEEGPVEEENAAQPEGDASPPGAGGEKGPSAQAGTPPQYFFEDFLTAGRSVQESQIRAFEQLFETFVPGDQPG